MGATEFYRGKYRTYGEGSVHHMGNPCEHGIGEEHPLIERTDWPSRRAFWSARFWGFVLDHPRLWRWWTPRVKTWPPSSVWLARWGWLVSKAVPTNVPRVRASLRPEDSVYGDRKWCSKNHADLDEKNR